MPGPLATPSHVDLQERLHGLMLRDQRRLRRRIERARTPEAELAVLADVEAAERRVERRRRAVPAVTYPASLPISGPRDDLLAAIRDHQVVIVAGETGSGKTTQLPKMCLELGRGVTGMIGHTQPRRLAARTVAERIAEELGTELGGAVGYKVRFSEQVGDATLVKLMTDGMLLAEIEHDRQLRQYDTLIIDEAHERSLNVDFLLGYVKQLLPRRPDLKVIITSATIETERFSRHFGGAPVLTVSGRSYPVEVRYRPLAAEDDDADDRDQTEAISDAVDELCAQGPGDILVFLSGEREIRETAEALRGAGRRDLEVLPLYSRLSTAEQRRVFSPHAGRRVVLATNVAETSLTVPGIRYVIDPGTARISRYSARTKVQRLPIEPVSQASANQRKGRCGRTSDGICIRLYSETDFASRPEYTDPEILRTNLASVILQMTALGLGDIAGLDFLDQPDPRSVRDGVQLLEELGALDGRRLTEVGRKLAQLPIDPRLARMVVEADRVGALREVLIVTAALSIQDPRERPADKQQAADEQHGRFADPDSDFATYLNLWAYLREQQEALSSNQFRRRCRAEFLNAQRVREWQDLESQLRQVVQRLGMKPHDAPAQRQDLHRALLSGLLSHIGLKDGDGREYQGARNVRFAVFPGSALSRKPPRWVMAAELVETSRLWGRTVARIEPEWAEALAPHLVKRTYSEPHWERERGAVVAYERVTLYGVPIVVGRKVDFGRIDPALARELFLRHALVEGDWDAPHAFLSANRKLLEDAEDLEHRVRRRGLVVDDDARFAFYDQRAPAEVTSARHFDRWWKQVRADRPDLLTFDRSMLLRPDAGFEALDHPDVWELDGLRLPLSYRFEPGAPDDGVTVCIPLAALNRVRADGFGWQVPGLREELVTALIRSLPKDLRRSLVPAPDRARAVLERVTPADGPLLEVLERELGRMAGVPVPRGSWDLGQVPAHLRMTFRVVDDAGRTVAEGKDLEALRRRLRAQVHATVAAAGDEVARHGLRGWTIGTLPRVVRRDVGGLAVQAYPALVDEGDSVAVRVFATEAEQQQAMWRGTRRLLILGVPSPNRALRAGLTNETKLALSRSPYRDVAALLSDCIDAAVDQLVADHGGPAWDAEGFDRLLATVRAGLDEAVLDILGRVARVVPAAQRIQDRLRGLSNPGLAPVVADVTAPPGPPAGP
jgi:ATP-dependent helicase HrpA